MYPTSSPGYAPGKDLCMETRLGMLKGPGGFPFRCSLVKIQQLHVFDSKYFLGKRLVLSSSLPNSVINFMPCIGNICLCCQELYPDTNPRDFTILVTMIPAHSWLLISSAYCLVSPQDCLHLPSAHPCLFLPCHRCRNGSNHVPLDLPCCVFTVPSFPG